MGSRLGLLFAIIIAGVTLVTLLSVEREATEASHPDQDTANGNQAVAASWFNGCNPCWANNVIDWAAGDYSPGLPLAVKESSYYPHKSTAWHFPSWLLVITRNQNISWNVVHTVILPHQNPNCTAGTFLCQTYRIRWTQDQRVVHANIYYLSSSTGHRCAVLEQLGWDTPAYFDCIATTISHEIGHTLGLADHSDSDPTIMVTPPRPLQYPTQTDKWVTGVCFYVPAWC